MASNRANVVGLVVIMVMFMVVLCDGATVESSKCRSAIVSLSPCLNYVSGNSSSPSHPCCSQLANVVRSEPRCLCVLVSGGHSSASLNINETLALRLPKACDVHTPPVSRCDGMLFFLHFSFFIFGLMGNKVRTHVSEI